MEQRSWGRRGTTRAALRGGANEPARPAALVCSDGESLFELPAPALKQAPGVGARRLYNPRGRGGGAQEQVQADGGESAAAG